MFTCISTISPRVDARKVLISSLMLQRVCKEEKKTEAVHTGLRCSPTAAHCEGRSGGGAQALYRSDRSTWRIGYFIWIMSNADTSEEYQYLGGHGFLVKAKAILVRKAKPLQFLLVSEICKPNGMTHKSSLLHLFSNQEGARRRRVLVLDQPSTCSYHCIRKT